MIIQKLTNGNVVLPIRTTKSNDSAVCTVQQVGFQLFVDGSFVKITKDDFILGWISIADVTGTQVLPAASIPFTGTAQDLMDILAADFFFLSSEEDAVDVIYDNTVSGLTAINVQDAIDEIVDTGIFTIELMNALTVDFYAPYDLAINSVSNILNSPTTTIQDDNVAYVLGATIAAGSKITVTVNTASVVNLNITKA